MTSGVIKTGERVRIMSIEYGSFAPMKCHHCPNFSPMWTVRCFVENARVPGSFGRDRMQNFYKTLFLCAPCKDKFKNQWSGK